MSLVQFLVQDAQPGYEEQVESIARNWESLLGPQALELLDEREFVDRVIHMLESGVASESVQIQIISDLLSLAWWRGFSISDLNAGRLFHCATKFFVALSDTIQLPQRAVSLEDVRRNHCVFVGTLQDPLHSPSSSAIDYVSSLALNPEIKNIDIYYGGQISPRMQAYIDDKFASLSNKSLIKFVPNDLSENLLKNIYSKNVCMFHFMCEPHLSALISVLNFMGPTVMFVCNDEIPMQYCDVYWYIHSADYIANLWQRRGSTPPIIENYVQIKTSSASVAMNPRGKNRSDYNLRDSNFVMATVGNRLGIDLDEAFVTGMEGILKNHPHSIWMIVGECPENIRLACEQVLGEQFRYVPFDPELDRLMAMVDVFANPFRPGGGTSAYIALGSGCVVLSLNTGGVSSLIPAEHCGTDPEDYFLKLSALIQSPGMLDDWRAVQKRGVAAVADPAAFSKSLFDAIDTAHARFERRRGQSLAEMIYGPQSTGKAMKSARKRSR